jgi:hypothetical protein
VKDEQEQLTISGAVPARGQGATSRPGRVGSRGRRRLPSEASGSRAVTPRAPAVAAPVMPDRPARPSLVAAQELYGLGVRTDLVTACRIALGVGSTTAYALAGRGELPFAAYRVGRQWVVPTAGLLTFLGLPPQEPPSPGTT